MLIRKVADEWTRWCVFYYLLYRSQRFRAICSMALTQLSLILFRARLAKTWHKFGTGMRGVVCQVAARHTVNISFIQSSRTHTLLPTITTQVLPIDNNTLVQFPHDS